jgi:putative copper export protein
MNDAPPKPSTGSGDASWTPASITIDLSELARRVHLEKPTLKEVVAKRVLNLFSVSLIATLVFAVILFVVDSCFIVYKHITPEQRLVTDKVVMTFVAATVVQVGAALAAIVIAVFKETPARDENPDSDA